MTWKQCDEELKKLWTRCADGQATERDWKALYALVARVLLNCKAPQLESLPDDGKHAYVDEFFVQKVFLPMRPGLVPYHCGALVVFFRRYLLSLIRTYGKFQPIVDDEAEAGTKESEGENLERKDRSNQELEDRYGDLATHCDTSVAAVRESAEKLIEHLKSEEHWAWLMLRYHFFPADDERVPISRLAKQYGISSAHYRAGELGLRHNTADLLAYQETMLGHWLKETLGKELSPDLRPCVDLAFEILGYVTLKG